MTPEEFIEELRKNTDKDYGIMPLPTDAQYGLDILITHFLGEDWYAIGSMHTAQVNTEAICEILKRYPNAKQEKERRRKRIGDFFHNIIDNIFG